MSFGVGNNDDERIEAFELYKCAFGGKKISESRPPCGGDIHIVIEIGGVNILLGPPLGEIRTELDDVMVCEMHFYDESEFQKAYEALSKKSLSRALEGPYPWATKLGIIKDKYGVGWALYFHS